MIRVLLCIEQDPLIGLVWISNIVLDYLYRNYVPNLSPIHPAIHCAAIKWRIDYIINKTHFRKLFWKDLWIFSADYPMEWETGSKVQQMNWTCNSKDWKYGGKWRCNNAEFGCMRLFWTNSRHFQLTSTDSKLHHQNPSCNTRFQVAPPDSQLH